MTRAPNARVGHRLCLAARAHGALLGPLGESAMFMPPLVMTPADIGHLGRGGPVRHRRGLG